MTAHIGEKRRCGQLRFHQQPPSHQIYPGQPPVLWSDGNVDVRLLLVWGYGIDPARDTTPTRVPAVAPLRCRPNPPPHGCDGDIWPLNWEDAVLILPRMVHRVRSCPGLCDTAGSNLWLCTVVLATHSPCLDFALPNLLTARARHRLSPRTWCRRWLRRVPMLYGTRPYSTPARLPRVSALTCALAGPLEHSIDPGGVVEGDSHLRAATSRRQ